MQRTDQKRTSVPRKFCADRDRNICVKYASSSREYSMDQCLCVSVATMALGHFEIIKVIDELVSNKRQHFIVTHDLEEFRPWSLDDITLTNYRVRFQTQLKLFVFRPCFMYD